MCGCMVGGVVKAPVVRKGSLEPSQNLGNLKDKNDSPIFPQHGSQSFI